MRLSSLAVGAVIVAAVGATAFLDERNTSEKPETAPIDSIASPAGPGSAEPNLAVGADGKVYMTWLEPLDSGHALRLATLTGRQWSTPVTIRSGRDFFVNWADFPSVEVIGDRRLAVHWLQRIGKTPYAYGVRIARSNDDGLTWEAPLIPHRDTVPQEHGFVAMWREGTGMGAVWLDGRKMSGEGHEGHGGSGDEMTLMATSIDANGKLGPEILLDSRTCDCCQNTVAMTSRGPIVAYRNRTADEIRDIYVTRRVAGKWMDGAPVWNDNWKIAACPVNGPALAASGDRVALAWFTGARDTLRVNVAFSNDAGASWGKPTRVDNGAPGGRVDAVLLDDGSALVSWIERIGGDTAAVRVRRVMPNGRSGLPITIARSSTARASGVPKMVRAGADVVFAWTVPGRPSFIRVARGPAGSFR
jgi:hypothetical protein